MALTRTSRLSRAVIGSAVITSAVLLTPLAADAIPHPKSPAQTTTSVNAKLAALAKTSEQLAEQYNKAQLDVVGAQHSAEVATQQASQAQAAVRTTRHDLAASLATQYKSASFSRTAAMMASTSTDGYLQTMQSMTLITQHQGEVATRASKAIAISNAASQKARDAVSTAVSERAAIAQRRAALDAQVKTYQALLATLTAAERAKFFTPVPPPTAAQVAKVVDAPRPAATQVQAPQKQQPQKQQPQQQQPQQQQPQQPQQQQPQQQQPQKPAPQQQQPQKQQQQQQRQQQAPPKQQQPQKQQKQAPQQQQQQAPAAAAVPQVQQASQGAAAAIASARAELGKPYVWGASGPDSFDCSGLTAWAWGHAGVNLPHSAAAQQGMGSSVGRSELQPGDLVFFGSPAYHVALYIGGGLIIHAPTTGDVVKIASLSYLSDYSGARRVG